MAVVSISFVLAIIFGALAAADLLSRVHVAVVSLLRSVRRRESRS